jgi:pimeloyl-ACP methyl ester carboxylesterase
MAQARNSSEQDKMTDYLQIDNHRIAYTMTGSPSNPPVILIHGLMSHRGVWTRTVEALNENFFCIAPDLPGFGDSDKPKNGDYTIAKQAERILKVADHFGFDKFILIGHSMGGQISTYLAATLAPQRVHKLISVDGVVTGELSESLQNTRRMTAIAQRNPWLYQLSRKLNKWKPYAYRTFQPWFYKIKDLPFDSWEVDRDHASDPGIAPSTPKAWDSLNATNLTPTLKNIIAPTLVIFGIQDGTVPVAQARLFKEKLSAAQLVLIDQCGHFPMYEAFDKYINHVQGFLNKLTG